MARYSAQAALALKTVQMILMSMQSALAPTSYLCPESTTIETIDATSWDYVLIGGGEAGSVVAFRLAETGANVLVLEEGGCPPLESIWAGYFGLLPKSPYDRAMQLYNDSYANQNQRLDNVITQGVMLGGTGSINHMIYVPPNEADYEHWAEAANDKSWGFQEFAEYFAKGENVQDEGVLAQNTSLHGACGPSIVSRDEDVLASDMIRAHKDLGFPYLVDANGLCVCQPTLSIGDGLRQCGHVAYISKIVDKPNVRFLTNAVVTKILFNGITATGVQFVYNNSTFNVTATKKVIVSAGAIKSPQLLMLSGIGNKTVLSKFDINTVVDNSEVGQNLKDHVGVLFGISLNKNTKDSAISNPKRASATVITVYDAIDKSQKQPELQNIILKFGANSSRMIEFCLQVYHYSDAICDGWYKSNLGRDFILHMANLMHPESKGSVTLKTTKITDQPIIKLGHLSNSVDLDNFAKLMVQYVEDLLNTATFTSLGAQFVDLGLCTAYDKFSLDYWKCYIVEMSTTMWHYTGTCAIGKVVDADLNVVGTRNLKVIDASVIPYPPSGNIGSSVQALAEKGADLIKKEDGYLTKAEVCI